MGKSARMAAKREGNVSRELIEPLVRRFMSGQLPAQAPPPSLPEDKAQFPKLLCLDFNKWVALARSKLGIDSDPASQEALSAIEAGTRSGKLVVPLIHTNILEAAAPRNSDQRNRIAECMVTLSGNLSLLNGITVAQHEFVLAVKHLRFGAPLPHSLRPFLVQRGMDAAVLGKSLRFRTGNIDVDNMLNTVGKQPEISAAAIAQLVDESAHRNLRSGDEDSVPKLEAIRKLTSGQTREQRAIDEVINALDGKRYRDALAAEGIPVDETLLWLQERENAKAVLRLLPHLDVGVTLICMRDTNPQHPIRGTDTRDLPFFSLALPYANVVVAEKAWSHLATASSTPLAKRYGAMVLTKLADVPQVLRRIGCL